MEQIYTDMWIICFWIAIFLKEFGHLFRIGWTLTRSIQRIFRIIYINLDA